MEPEAPAVQELGERSQDERPERSKLVEEQHPSARQADLAGARTRPQKPKRPQAQPGPAEGRATPARWLDPRPDVGLGNLGGLLVGQERQKIGKAAGQHRLAGARRPEKEQGVLPGGGDLEDAFGRLVPPDLREVWP